MESQYLEFLKVDETEKTQIWQVLSMHRGYVLGHIKWYGPWRQYCFYPTANTVFNVGCLLDIRFKIKELMDERKKK